eukprot:gene4185-biopygen11423
MVRKLPAFGVIPPDTALGAGEGRRTPTSQCTLYLRTPPPNPPHTHTQLQQPRALRRRVAQLALRLRRPRALAAQLRVGVRRAAAQRGELFFLPARVAPEVVQQLGGGGVLLLLRRRERGSLD